MSVPVQATPQPAASVPRQELRGHAWLAVAGPTGLAAVLSLYQVTSRSLGFDEGATVAIASQHGAGLWSAIAHDGGNMSIYYLLIHLLISAFGNGLLVVRLPSMVAFVATVALIGVIGNRLFCPLVSLVAGLLAAVSLPLVYWAQTARGYAPMVAFVCAAYVAFIALGDPRPDKPPGRWPWLAYVLAMTLAMYCSVVAILVIPAQLLVVVRRRASLVRVGSALAVIAVGCIPLAILAVRRGSGQLFWVPRPTRMVESQVLQSLTSAGLAPTFHKHPTTYVLMWVTVAAIFALVLDVIRRRRRGEAVWAMATVLAWCVVPAGLTFVYSFVSQPIFVPRNLVMSTPAVAVALAAGLREVAGRGEVAEVGAMRA
ncbi:MAG: glycosyltransferase family 39 protein, partial [Solirubrobacteraceae bacterium]